MAEEKKDVNPFANFPEVPKYQFTIQDKDLNLTCRNDDKEELIEDVMDLRERLFNEVLNLEADEGIRQDFKTANEPKKLCPKCGTEMIHQKGTSKKTGKPYDFWGCSRYPDCDGKA